MKATLLRSLTALFAVCSFIAGLGAYLDVLPVEYAKIDALILAAVLGLKEIVVIIGDLADDGQRNGSFKVPPVPLVLAFILPLLASCATRVDGTKTFLSLDAAQWGRVGLEVGKGAIKTAVPAYLEQRQNGSNNK